jgi:hypothetical protein
VTPEPARGRPKPFGGPPYSLGGSGSLFRGSGCSPLESGRATTLQFLESLLHAIGPRPLTLFAAVECAESHPERRSDVHVRELAIVLRSRRFDGREIARKYERRRIARQRRAEALVLLELLLHSDRPRIDSAAIPQEASFWLSRVSPRSPEYRRASSCRRRSVRTFGSRLRVETTHKGAACGGSSASRISGCRTSTPRAAADIGPMTVTGAAPLSASCRSCRVVSISR